MSGRLKWLLGQITKRETLAYTRQFTYIDEGQISRQGMHEVRVRYNQSPYRILFTFVLKNGGGTAPLGIAGKG